MFVVNHGLETDRDFGIFTTTQIRAKRGLH